MNHHRAPRFRAFSLQVLPNILLNIFLNIFWVVLFAASVLSCGSAASESKRIVPASSAYIPVSNSGIASEENSTASVSPGRSGISAFIPENYIVLDSVSENINNDDLEEDIIAYTTYPSNEVFILVASFDDASKSYKFLWQAKSGVLGSEPMYLTVRDISADSRKEIIVRGTALRGEEKLQAIEVFHIPKSGAYDVTKYAKAFEATANSGIDLQDVSADAGNRSIPIVAYSVNQNRSITRTIYEWRNASETYETAGSTTFERESIVKQRIDSLYYGNTTDWQNYLRGLWRKKSSAAGTGRDQETLLYFSSAAPNISVYTADSAQVFTWLSTVRTIDSSGTVGAQALVQNMILPEVKKKFYIRIIDEKTISVVLGNDLHGALSSGTYGLVSDVKDFPKTLLAVMKNSAFDAVGGAAAVAVAGSFQNADDKALYEFNDPILTVSQAEQGRRAAYFYSTFYLQATAVMELTEIAGSSSGPGISSASAPSAASAAAGQTASGKSKAQFYEIVSGIVSGGPAAAQSAAQSTGPAAQQTSVQQPNTAAAEGGTILLRPVHVTAQNIYPDSSRQTLTLQPVARQQ